MHLVPLASPRPLARRALLSPVFATAPTIAPVLFAAAGDGEGLLVDRVVAVALIAAAAAPMALAALAVLGLLG